MGIWQTRTVARILRADLLGDPDLEVRGCVLDSRLVQGGEIFMAFSGQKVDGAAFIASAWERGAVLAVAEISDPGKPVKIPAIPKGKALIFVASAASALQKLAQVRRRESGARVIGITGSNGKTTTKDMLAAVLARKYKVYQNIDNQNNELGLPLTILNAPAGTEMLVLEMGMRGLNEIEALCKIARPDTGVITNIGISHLELLGTQDNIARAKWELIANLPAAGRAILNAEDYYSCQKAQNSCTPLLYYGLKGRYHRPDVKGSNLRQSGVLGTVFTVTYDGQSAEVELPLPGEHNVLNALAALAVGIEWGIPLEVGALGLAGLEISQMRLEVLEGRYSSVLVSDVYNANPLSMQASLKILKERAGQKPTLAILGEMYELGSNSQSGHREVGATAAKLGISRLITVGQMAGDIARGAQNAGFPDQSIETCASLEEAAGKAIKILEGLESGAWVLIKGSRGMKMEEITARLRKEEGKD
ncbi:MAG: UDP-N-acetylmuramoyl-tripeptide--D-alanyl-D-alanine ligase [Desulfitobacteriaceae bacterium]|nr:UDP-N-acetylmuramoyl-tripeptide--D-alanyl-D-alanine ligase [Clostridia bacterium]MDD4345868.1 UDP-N-acetylmuramoyl-tripeptide--D-alanyl-D-alanine ligase [Desulfitobacteriaceae bacterium]MDD4400765.1 UDP-N-acetylmuramoyl-tripeptide--D-alanyl-D-alanine ligase [Desulfitobacteriaceae bacterium]